jgi:hypothetical protein
MSVTYFSEARGLRKGFGLTELRAMTKDLFNDLREGGQLTEWLGYWCVDEGDVPGKAGHDPGRAFRRDVGRNDVWPVEPVEREWPEDAIFDFLQYLGTQVSTPDPENGYYHDFNGCGWHYKKFSVQPARSEYTSQVNRLLSRYNDGWEMKENFEIVERAPAGMNTLLAAGVPGDAGLQVNARVQAAIDKYRRRNASASDRRDAVRDLGDIFELMRSDAKLHLNKDEADLFSILNNFNIRHANARQKSGYDAIWLSALFYHYLAMIHVLTRIIARNAAKKK